MLQHEKERSQNHSAAQQDEGAGEVEDAQGVAGRPALLALLMARSRQPELLKPLYLSWS